MKCKWMNDWMKMNVGRHARLQEWGKTPKSAIWPGFDVCVPNQQTNRPTDRHDQLYRGARTRMRKKEQLDVTRVEHGGWNSESECMTTRKKALTNVLWSLAYVKAASTLPFLGFGISYRVGKIRLLIDRWKGVHWPITCIYLMCRLSSCEFGHRRPKMIVVEEKYISPSI